MPRKEDATTPATDDALDPTTLERMREETAELLAAAPEAFDAKDAEAAARTAADLYVPPTGYDVNDPEDLTALLNLAFKNAGIDVPDKLLQAAKAAQNPIRPASADPMRQDVELLSETDEVERQRKVYEKYQRAVAAPSNKRGRMISAINASPVVQYLNRHDRWLQINGVKITVPEGLVRIPKIIADFCDDQDAHEQWAANYKRDAQRFLNIERTTSFVQAKVESFSIS